MSVVSLKKSCGTVLRLPKPSSTMDQIMALLQKISTLTLPPYERIEKPTLTALAHPMMEASNATALN